MSINVRVLYNDYKAFPIIGKAVRTWLWHSNAAAVKFSMQISFEVSKFCLKFFL